MVNHTPDTLTFKPKRTHRVEKPNTSVILI